MFIRILTALMLFLSLQNAYAFFGASYPASSLEVYELGTSQLEKRQFKKAVKTFEHFLEKHSNSDLLGPAKVRLADAYYGSEKFAAALKLYERSHLDSPYSDEGAHTLFQMGMCNMEFISKHKGNKYIPYAVAAFERFQNLYPEHPLASEAIKQIRSAKKIEAEYQIEVGNYYFSHKDFCAAFNHFNKVLLLEDFGTFKSIDTYVAKCQKNESCLNEVASCEFDLTEINRRFK